MDNGNDAKFRRPIGEYSRGGLRAGEVGEVTWDAVDGGEGVVGNEGESSMECAEGATDGADAVSAAVLWPRWRGLLHLRCQRQTWAMARE